MRKFSAGCVSERGPEWPRANAPWRLVTRRRAGRRAGRGAPWRGARCRAVRADHASVGRRVGGARAAPARSAARARRPPGRRRRQAPRRRLEVLRPQAQARLASEGGLAADDVHLGVVEQGVVVEIRRTDGDPGVVDDPNLGMHVQRAREAPVRELIVAARKRLLPSSAAARTPTGRASSRRRCWGATGSSTTTRKSLGGFRSFLRGSRRAQATTGTGSRDRPARARRAALGCRSRGSRKSPAREQTRRCCSGTVRTTCTSPPAPATPPPARAAHP